MNKLFQLAVFGLALTFSSSSFGAQSADFTPKAFDQAIKDGKIVLLDFKASYCGTCKKQGESLKKLSMGAYKKTDNIVFLKVDFESASQKGTPESLLKAKYNVVKQSTFVLLKGDKENPIASAMGKTDPQDIAQFINQAI